MKITKVQIAEVLAIIFIALLLWEMETNKQTDPIFPIFSGPTATKPPPSIIMPD